MVMEGGDEDMEVNMGGKTHYGGVKNVHIVLFSKGVRV
jgi:hypothetical protein